MDTAIIELKNGEIVGVYGGEKTIANIKKDSRITEVCNGIIDDLGTWKHSQYYFKLQLL